MRVHVKVLLPMLAEALGGRVLDVELAGETVSDLIQHLVARHGRKARKALYDNDGRLDPVIQILVNGERWVMHDRLDTILQDGDDVMLLMMLAGG
jgi:MoaD family protein